MRPMATDRAGSPPVLACEDLRKSFGDRLAVDGVGFTIGPSETYGLLGPNGAGKTTTISMICGLLVRDGGTVLVDGAPLDVNAVAAKGAVGFVPQDLAIYPELTARENLRFSGSCTAGRCRAAIPDGRGARAHRPRRSGGRTDRWLLGRHEAAPEYRHRPAQALDGFRELIVGGDLVAILPQVGVLLGLAAVVLGLATWRLRAALTH